MAPTATKEGEMTKEEEAKAMKVEKRKKGEASKKEDKETRLNPHEYFKTRFKLMLNKGKFCIFEHIDQHPLFVNNFGMASRLKRYYYGDKQPSKKEFLN